VVGDRRPYVAALVTVDEDELKAWTEEHGVTADPAHDERLRAAIQEQIDEVNRHLARYEQIKRFEILPRDFTQEEGEVTPTLKLKRRVIEQRFAGEIDSLYS
jgi:long-chain acyl-CoA synthetase